MAEKDERGSVGSDDIPPIVDTEVNPEGYGIEGEFVPTAVFEVIEDKPPPSEDNLFDDLGDDLGDDSTLADWEGAREYEEGDEGEGDELEEEGEEGEEGEEEGLEGEEAMEGEGGEEISVEGIEGEEFEKIEGEIEEEEGEEEEEEEGEGEGEEEGERAEEEEEGEEGEEEGEEGEGEEGKGEEEKVEEVKGEEIKKEGEEEAPKEVGEEEKAGVKFGEEDEEKEEKKKPKKEMFKRRLSIRKKSIFYPMVSRFREGEDRRVSGDFAAIQEDLLGTVTSPSIASFEPESGEYVYEEEVEEEEIPPIDREYYYNVHKTITPIRIAQKMKNNFLHRKMADYFKKRKMEHVLKETDQQIDSQAKYEKKLDSLAELRDLDTRERNSITTELNDMRSQRNDHRSMLAVHFTAMQNREKEIGTGLINTKTGKEIPDKVIDHLLKRQRHKLTEIANMRLTYIKIRDRVAEKKAALHALDCIGDNLHLIDYEQLKIENQSHTDKIEERDEELNKLRIKCQGAMQCLAHVREKSAAVLLDVQHLNERYDEVEMEYMECRERVNYFKQERDKYRFETDKLCEESGLLSKPKLLQDMEKAIEDVKIKSKQLAALKEENERLTGSLKAIKKNIAEAPTKVHTLKAASVRFNTSSRKIYKGRPTLIYPQLPHSDWSESTDTP